MAAADGSRLRSFLLGGLVGGVAAIVAGKLTERRRIERATPPGLAAFEQAPCFREALEREQHEPEQ